MIEYSHWFYRTPSVFGGWCKSSAIYYFFEWLFTNLIFFIFSYTSSVFNFLNHNFLHQSIFAFDIVDLLLILLHFSDSVYIGIGTKMTSRRSDILLWLWCVWSKTRRWGVFIFKSYYIMFIWLSCCIICTKEENKNYAESLKNILYT